MSIILIVFCFFFDISSSHIDTSSTSVLCRRFFSISPQVTLSLVVQVFSVAATISGTGKVVVGAGRWISILLLLSLATLKPQKSHTTDLMCTELM